MGLTAGRALLWAYDKGVRMVADKRWQNMKLGQSVLFLSKSVDTLRLER
jgi:hypothetical protein